MKERPIIFSTNMVKAILEDKKMQTRRVVKFKNVDGHRVYKYVYPHPNGGYSFQDFPSPNGRVLLLDDTGKLCPYGQVGDRLWVRETFVLESTEGYGYAGLDIPNINPKKYVPWTWEGEFGDYYLIPHYRATEPEPNIVSDEQFAENDDTTRWSSAIFMPRWASRITLEITGVRVERLQEISEEDALAEGIQVMKGTWQKIEPSTHKLIGEPQPFTARYHFEALWDNLNLGRGYGWETNPWVWVIEFKRISP